MQKIHININEKQSEMVEKIKNDNGLFSISEAVRFCISYTYKKENPGYIELQKERLATRLTPEEKARGQVAMRELRDNEKANKSFKLKTGICEELGGTMEMINGQSHCVYKLYTEVPGHEVESVPITEPFDTLSEDTVNFQYRDLMGNTGKIVKKKLLSIINKK